MLTLSNKTYNFKDIPEQWLFGKVIPVFKKDEKKNIENYRHTTNICFTSKILENLQRIIHLEEIHKNGITYKSQHSFKQKHSTKTADLLIQLIIVRALDEDQYAIWPSLDL